MVEIDAQGGVVKRRDLFGKAFQENPFAKVAPPSRWDEELRVRLSRLPLLIARADALAEIARGRLFRGTRGFLSEEERARLATLEPESRALFEKFRAVETNTIALSVSAIGPHGKAMDHIRIGTDAALGSVFVTAAAPTVFAAPDDADPPFGPASAVPSVWHYLLYARERGAA